MNKNWSIYNRQLLCNASLYGLVNHFLNFHYPFNKKQQQYKYNTIYIIMCPSSSTQYYVELDIYCMVI